LAAGAALAGTAFLAAGLAGVRAAAGLAGAFVAAVLAGVVVGVAVAVGFFAPVVVVATVLGAATFFGVVVRGVPGDALEDVTEVEVAFLVVSGFLRNRSTKPPSPLRGDSAGAGDFAPLALATGLFAGAGFDVAMGDLVQCVEGSRKTLVKFLGGKPKSRTGPAPIMSRLLSPAVQAYRTECQRASPSPAVSAAWRLARKS
jgi:hypothetical protein